MTHAKKNPACTYEKITVTRDMLPICCPLPDMEVWNAHPRVYLAFNDENQATCPYCSTEYFLQDETKS